MTVKRFIAAALLFCLGALLGSCGGASENGFSSFVADHWPQWAGGMPDDVPPRPGAPGYQQFIAHGQAGEDAAASATGAPPAAAAAKTQAPAAPLVPAVPVATAPSVAPTAPAGNRPSEDSSVVPGGLY